MLWAGFAAAFFKTPRCFSPSASLSESAAHCSRKGEEEEGKEEEEEASRRYAPKRDLAPALRVVGCVCVCVCVMLVECASLEFDASDVHDCPLHSLSLSLPHSSICPAYLQRARQHNGCIRVPAFLAAHVVGTMHLPALREELESSQARRESTPDDLHPPSAAPSTARIRLQERRRMMTRRATP